MRERINAPTTAHRKGGMSPEMRAAALSPGAKVCPWGAGDGRVEIVLIDSSRQRVMSVTCTPDQIDGVKEIMREVAWLLDPHPALWVE